MIVAISAASVSLVLIGVAIWLDRRATRRHEERTSRYAEGYAEARIDPYSIFIKLDPDARAVDVFDTRTLSDGVEDGVRVDYDIDDMGRVLGVGMMVTMEAGVDFLQRTSMIDRRKAA